MSLKRLLLGQGGEPINLTLGCYSCFELDQGNPGGSEVVDDATGLHDGYLHLGQTNWLFNQTGKLDDCWEDTNAGGDPKVFRTDITISTTDYSVSAWMKSDSAGIAVEAARWDVQQTSEKLVLLGISPSPNDRIKYYYDTGSSTAELTTSGSPYVPNQWNHVVVVRDSGVIKIWVNGVKEAEASATYAPWVNTFFRVYGGTIPGFFDQFAVWTRGLNDAEVLYLNNNNNGLRYINW